MTLRGRVDQGTTLLIIAIIAAAILPSGSLPKCTPFSVRSPCLHQKVPFLLRQGAATSFYAKRDAHHIRCSAVALAVSGNPVCQAGDDDSASATTHASSRGDPGQQAIVHGADTDAAAASAEVEERTVVGEIVLSDWLEELPLASFTLPGGGQRSREGEHGQQGRVEVVTSSSARGSNQHGEQGERYGDDISAPFRFQQLIQHMWAELSRGEQLEYLGAEGQARVKGALTVLAAYGALREHPLQAGVNSPQQAFSEMDFDMDGEVSFDEFVRWYSMSSALDEPEQGLPQSDAAPTRTPTTPIATASATSAVAIAAATGDPSGVPPTGTSALARPERAATAPPLPMAAGGGGASRLLSDLEKSLTRADRTLGTAPPIQQRSPISTMSATAPATAPATASTTASSTASATAPATAPTAQATASAGKVASESTAAEKRPMVLLPSVGSLSLEVAVGAGFGPTEAEKEAARERWLAGGGSNVGGGEEVAGMEGGGDGYSAAKDLEKALELLCVLVNANADADTLIAALASCIIRNPMGSYNLEVIEEQFGAIIRGIVEDRLLLERLPEPTSSASYVAIQQSHGVRPVLDLDDYHAKLMRDYLVHSSRDARAVVVHMADLTCRLRERSNIPVYAKHSLALEAIQLYVPVSNALGLGSSFLELEELGYKALFPQTYSNMALWHHGVKGRSHDIVHDVKRRMLEALRAREDIAERVRAYHLEGRTKGLVSTFRKVFRQNKRATDVHDILGFRIVVSPGSPPPRVHAASTTGKPGTTSPEDGSVSIASKSPASWDDSGRHVSPSKHAQETYSGAGTGDARAGGVGVGGARDMHIEASIEPGGEGRKGGFGEIGAGGTGVGGRRIGRVGVGARDVHVEPGGKKGGEAERGSVGVGGGSEASKPARSVFTVKTFPPPYRDDDSRLLHDVYEVLVGLFEEVPGRYKNYVDFPKANGYRSVHTTVMHPSGLKMEFQVRTAKMHSDAEGGAAAHSLYKGNLENPAEASLFRSKMTPNKSPPVQQHRLSSKKGKSATASTAGVGSPAAIDSTGSSAVHSGTLSEHGERRREGPGQLGEGSDLESSRSPEP